MIPNLFARLFAFACLFTASWGGFSAYAGEALAPHAELGVYRFYGRPDTNSAYVGVYSLGATGLFVPKQVGQLTANPTGKSDDCTQLLSSLQSFPLNVMTQVNYLSPGEFNDQEQLIKIFAPEQVTFLELTEPVAKKEVIANPAAYPRYKISNRPDEARPDHFHIRQAGMWIISGQSMYPWGGEVFEKHHPGSTRDKIDITWQTAVPKESSAFNESDPHSVLLTLTAMPWQLNSALWESGGLKKNRFGWADIDRKKYPLVWEIGRAAQTKPEQMNALFSAAASIIAEEVLVSLQSRYEDAFVFCKALDEDRMRLFRLIGFEPLEGACPKKDNCVMVAPLTKLLKRFPVGRQSGRANQIREALKNKIPLDDSLNILRRIQTYFRADLDVILKNNGYHQRSPLVVHDFSPNYFILLRLLGQMTAGLSVQEALEFASRFSAFRGDHGDRFGVKDLIPAEHFIHDFTKRNIVRITNLDESLAQRDSEYLPTVLIGVREYLAFRYEELQVPGGHQLLENFKTQIAIQTTSNLVAAQAHQLGGASLPPQRGADGRYLFTSIFDMEKLAAMANAKPERVERGKFGVQQGFWFFRSITASPLKF